MKMRFASAQDQILELLFMFGGNAMGKTECNTGSMGFNDL